jgi:hypothetical protein
LKLEALIREVRQIGYQIRVKDEDILLTWTKEGHPPSETITPLLLLLKQQKGAILEYLRGEDEIKSDEQFSLPWGESMQVNHKKRLISEGRVQGAKMLPVKIFSRLFNEEIWLVATKEEMEALVSKGVKEIVYMAWEIPLLKGMDKEKLMTIHSVKKIFPGSGLVC